MDEITVSDAGGVRSVGLNRPLKRNALTPAMYQALGAALALAGAAGSRAIWLHGSAECFTAGNDLGDFAVAHPGARPAMAFLEQLAACETPIVASVNGAAVGIGATLLLHCDLAYCSAGARFQLPFVDLGLCPEAASSLLLPGRAGLLRASELLLLGEPFDPATAREAGLVNAVLPDAEAADAMGRRRAAALAAKPPEALRASRALLRQGSLAAVQLAMRAEAAEFGRLLQGAEAREALNALREKRSPEFFPGRQADPYANPGASPLTAASDRE